MTLLIPENPSGHLLVIVSLLLCKTEGIYCSLVALEEAREKKYLQCSLSTSLCIHKHCSPV